MTNVLHLSSRSPTRPAPVKRKPRVQRMLTRQQKIDMLHRQADRAGRGDWSFCDELRDLIYMVKTRRPRTRSVSYLGIRFPLRFTLIRTYVICPQSGRALAGVIG